MSETTNPLTPPPESPVRDLDAEAVVISRLGNRPEVHAVTVDNVTSQGVWVATAYGHGVGLGQAAGATALEALLALEAL